MPNEIGLTMGTPTVKTANDLSPVQSLTDFADVGQVMTRLDALEAQNKQLAAQVALLTQDLSEIKDTVEYRTWCAEGMPGLIRPKNSTTLHWNGTTWSAALCECGHHARLHGPEGCRWRQGPENEDPECTCRCYTEKQP
jgi:hypothetical protein